MRSKVTVSSFNNKNSEFWRFIHDKFSDKKFYNVSHSNCFFEWIDYCHFFTFRMKVIYFIFMYGLTESNQTGIVCSIVVWDASVSFALNYRSLNIALYYLSWIVSIVANYILYSFYFCMEFFVKCHTHNWRRETSVLNISSPFIYSLFEYSSSSKSLLKQLGGIISIPISITHGLSTTNHSCWDALIISQFSDVVIIMVSLFS